MRTKIQHVPRERDEELLGILAGLANGRSTVSVGRQFHTTGRAVSVIRQRVMRDDLKYSGEPARTVRKAYGA